MLSKHGIQCNNQHFIKLMPLNHHSIAYRTNVSCTNDIIARDDDNSRLIGLVYKLGLVVRV
jgi:hypothetical protein